MFALIKKQLRENLLIWKGLRGNAKGMLVTEPMWGVPFNLYTAYASIYMLALGCNDTQVGLIASVGMVFQMFFSLISGYLTDRLGRRKTTLIFDLIGWTIPILIWALAQNFYYFLVAAIINSSYRIVHTSWSCLFVEDTDPGQRVHVYTWIYVAGILAGFFAPLAGLLVKHLTLVPAVRILYFFAFASMTSMFFLRNRLVRETRIGLEKMREARAFRLGETLRDYRRIGGELLKNPRLLLAFMLLILNNIHLTIRRTFLSIVLTKGLGFPKETIAIFPAVYSVAMLLVFVFIMPTLGKFKPSRPLLAGLVFSFAGYLVLVLCPGASFPLIILMSVLTAVGTAIVFPFVESVIANSIADSDRAKVIAILHVFLFAAVAPFGYVGGLLSSVSEKLPFVLILAQLAISALLVLGQSLRDRRGKRQGLRV